MLVYTCVCQYVCLSARVFACSLHVCLSTRVFVCTCVCLYVCLSVRVFVCNTCVCLHVCLSTVCTCVCLHVYLSADCTRVCLHVCLSVRVFVCTCVCLIVCFRAARAFVCTCYKSCLCSVADFNLAALYPNDIKAVLTYDGSLTTPDCTEVVYWVVVPELLTISTDQVNLKLIYILQA